MHAPLQFISTQIGYFLGEVMFVKFVGALLINAAIVHCIKLRDFYVMMISFATYAGLFISIGVSKTEWQIFAGINDKYKLNK